MPMFWTIIIILAILAAIVHYFLFIVLVAVVALIALIIMHKLNDKMKREHNIPKNAIKIRYYGGYKKKLSRKIYYWASLSSIFFNDPKTDSAIKINKYDIISFNTIGKYNVSQKISGGQVSGGGVSLGGAVVGGIIAGPVGAIIGGRKKVKSEPIRTENVVKDTRSVVLYFNAYNSNQKMVLDYALYKELCNICPGKNTDTRRTTTQSQDDIPTQIKKLANLKEQGILTKEEFEKKKAELLAKM